MFLFPVPALESERRVCKASFIGMQWRCLAAVTRDRGRVFPSGTVWPPEPETLTLALYGGGLQCWVWSAGMGVLAECAVLGETQASAPVLLGAAP